MVDETAVEVRAAGLWLGDRVLLADDVGREELADVGAAIGTLRHEGSYVVLASTLAISVVGCGHSRLGCSGARFPKATQLTAGACGCSTALRTTDVQGKAAKVTIPHGAPGWREGLAQRRPPLTSDLQPL